MRVNVNYNVTAAAEREIEDLIRRENLYNPEYAGTELLMTMAGKTCIELTQEGEAGNYDEANKSLLEKIQNIREAM